MAAQFSHLLSGDKQSCCVRPATLGRGGPWKNIPARRSRSLSLKCHLLVCCASRRLLSPPLTRLHLREYPSPTQDAQTVPEASLLAVKVNRKVNPSKDSHQRESFSQVKRLPYPFFS